MFKFDLGSLITELTSGDPNKIVTEVLSSVAQPDVTSVARDTYNTNQPKYVGSTAQDTLAGDTFDNTKHWLRGKIGVGVDIVWQFEAVRVPIREMAAEAATVVLSGTTPPPSTSAQTKLEVVDDSTVPTPGKSVGM